MTLIVHSTVFFTKPEHTGHGLNEGRLPFQHMLEKSSVLI